MSMIGSNAPTSATTKGEAGAAENCQRINKSVITASNEERVTLVKSGKCNKSIGTKTRIDVNPSLVPQIFKKMLTSHGKMYKILKTTLERVSHPHLMILINR